MLQQQGSFCLYSSSTGPRSPWMPLISGHGFFASRAAVVQIEFLGALHIQQDVRRAALTQQRLFQADDLHDFSDGVSWPAGAGMLPNPWPPADCSPRSPPTSMGSFMESTQLQVLARQRIRRPTSGVLAGAARRGFCFGPGLVLGQCKSRFSSGMVNWVLGHVIRDSGGIRSWQIRGRVCVLLPTVVWSHSFLKESQISMGRFTLSTITYISIYKFYSSECIQVQSDPEEIHRHF